jgi:hypothetical protein
MIFEDPAEGETRLATQRCSPSWSDLAGGDRRHLHRAKRDLPAG